MKAKGIKRLFLATKYSFNGFKAAYKNESAFRQEVVFGLPAIFISWLLPLSTLWSLVLSLSIIIVWAFELLNTAVEALADKVSQEHHSLIAVAKDCASAAVFCVLCLTLLIWISAIVTLLRQ